MALNVDTGQTVAIKRLSIDGLVDREIDRLLKEVRLLESLEHQSIVKYGGVVRSAGFISIVLE